MKSELSTIEIRALVNEMQFLTGARVDKIHNTADSVVFQLYSKEGKKFLKVAKKLLYICSEKQEALQPSQFCQLLRKYVENKRISTIKQHESERIIILSTENNSLVIELFGQANIILCDKNGIIIAALRIQASGNIVKPKAKYEFPAREVNILKIKEKEFSDLVKKSKNEIVKTLASFVGGLYAEEICLRAGINKNKKNPEDSEIKKLFSAFSSLLNERAMPFVVYDNSKIKDAVPFDLQIYGNFTKVAFSSFYEALDFALKESEGQEKTTEAEKKYAKQIQKIEEIISLQKKTLESLKKEHEENKRAGESVYENYNEIKNILSAFEEAKKKMPLPEIKSKIKNKKIISVENSKIMVDL